MVQSFLFVAKPNPDKASVSNGNHPSTYRDEQHQSQCDQRRQCLHKKDLLARRDGSINPGDRHTGKEEYGYINTPGRVADQQAPDQSGRQKTIVQALVRSHRPGRFKQLRSKRTPENFLPCFLPGEHLHPENIEMFQRHYGNKDLCSCIHDRCFTNFILLATRLPGPRSSPSFQPTFRFFPLRQPFFQTTFRSAR